MDNLRTGALSAEPFDLRKEPRSGSSSPPLEPTSSIDVHRRCLVGNFLDGEMDFPLLRATVKAAWKEYGIPSIKVIGSCYLFEFEDEETKIKVKEGGPYFFSHRYLVLRDWEKFTKPVASHPTSIPVWIKLHLLPLEFWTAQCFSRIGSTMGKPLHVDQATAGRLRLDFARICVEIRAGYDLPSQVTLRVGGDSVSVRIECERMPPVCASCKVFGHTCQPKPPQISVPGPLGVEVHNPKLPDHLQSQEGGEEATKCDNNASDRGINNQFSAAQTSDANNSDPDPDV